MARTKDAVLAPEQKELMEKEYLDFVKPSTYGNKANPSSCNSLYDDVENPELRAIVEKVAATTPYREETSTNEAQSSFWHSLMYIRKNLRLQWMMISILLMRYPQFLSM